MLGERMNVSQLAAVAEDPGGKVGEIVESMSGRECKTMIGRKCITGINVTTLSESTREESVCMCHEMHFHPSMQSNSTEQTCSVYL